jgi:hypothetical protein
MNFTLIDIIASSVVGVEFKSRIAACEEREGLSMKGEFCQFFKDSNRICSFPNNLNICVGTIRDTLGIHPHPRTFCHRSVHF